MSTLQQWLDDPQRSYKEGLMHYIMSGHGNSRLISSMSSCQEDPDNYHVLKLHYELENILRDYPDSYDITPIIQLPIKQDPIPVTSSSIIQKESSGEVRDTSDAKTWHKEQAHVHESMRNATNEQDRFKHADRIMKVIVPTLDAIYQGKTIPFDPENAPPPSELSEADCLKARNLIVARISKARKKLKEGNTSMQPVIDDLIEQRDALNQKLNQWPKV